MDGKHVGATLEIDLGDMKLTTRNPNIQQVRTQRGKWIRNEGDAKVFDRNL